MDVGRRAEHSRRQAAERPAPLAAALAAAPTFVAVALLLVTTWSDGAFLLRSWGPLAVFALIALAAGRRNGARGAPVLMAAAMWAFAAWCLLSAAWGSSPGNAIHGGARELLYAALVSLPLLTLPSRASGVRVAQLLTAGAAGLVALTFAACLLDGTGQFLAGRLNAPVDYRNGTAALFAMLFWLLIPVTSRRDAHALLRASCFALALIALGLAFLTQSRGVVVGFACGAVVAVALGPDRLRRAWLAILAAAAVAISSGPLLEPWDVFLDTTTTSPAAVDAAMGALGRLAAAGFAVSLLLALFDGGLRMSPAHQRRVRAFAAGGLVVLSLGAAIGGLAVAGDPVSLAADKVREFKVLDAPAPGATRLGSTGGQRYDLWRIAWDEFGSAPLHGVGRGSYQFDYFQRRATDQNLTDAHSLPLGVLAETGIVGALLLAAVLVAAALAIAGGWRSASAEERRWASALVAVAAVLLGQSTFDWLWLLPGIAGLGLVSLATAVAIVALPADAATPRRSRARVATRAVPVLAAALVAALFLSDVQVRSARAATAATSEQRLEKARAAGRLNPFALAPRYLQAGALEELGRRVQARAELMRALDMEPRNSATMALIGDLETRAGDRAAARGWYRRALALNPRDVGLQELAR